MDSTIAIDANDLENPMATISIEDDTDAAKLQLRFAGEMAAFQAQQAAREREAEARRASYQPGGSLRLSSMFAALSQQVSFASPPPADEDEDGDDQ